METRLSEEPVGLITEDISHVNLSIWVSFAEIYNEGIYDLLKIDSARGLQRQKLHVGYCNGSAYIKDLTYINVSSGLEAYHILQYGLHKLNYAATTINDHSSRSHSIFTIKLVQVSDTKDGISISSFNFCDLAGSERIKKTNNIGDRLKESNNINRSLSVLGRCISLIREAQKHNEVNPIPFRESKLTQLFQHALQGYESISMIVNINPIRSMFDESQHVLNFSAMAKDVIVEKQQIIKQVLGKEFAHNISKSERYNSDEKKQLLHQIDVLYDELTQRKLDHDEDRQNIISTYKKMIANTTEQWEKRCIELQRTFSKRIREQDTYTEHHSKKRKVSIINIDSSDDEDISTCKNNKNKRTLTELQCELEQKDQALKAFQEWCKCDSLKTQLENVECENYKLKEQLSELNDYIEAIQQVVPDLTEEKESSNSNCLC